MLSVRLALVLAVGIAGVLGGPAHHRQKRDTVYDDQWSTWGPCTHNCGDDGRQSRTLGCTDTDTGAYKHDCTTHFASCNGFSCDDPNDWQAWSECSEACDGGVRSRERGPDSTVGGGSEQIACNTQSCVAQTGCGKADLIFVLDASNSLGETNWYRTKQFVMDVTSGFDVSADQTRVGIVRYSTEVAEDVPLGAYTDRQDLHDQIWALPYMAGATNTADGLLRARDMAVNGARQDVQGILVVVTDGKSNILEDNTIPQADLCRQAGLMVFAIGVGEYDQVEVSGIANDPDEEFAFGVTDYEALSTITNEVIEGTCESTRTIVCDSWSDWGACSVSCGGGTQTRTQECRLEESSGNVLLTYQQEESQECGMDACPPPQLVCEDWSDWDLCSATCGGGTQNRTRFCSMVDHTGVELSTEEQTEEQECGMEPCEPDCTTCDFNNGVGYLQDELNCQCYYVCVKSALGYSHTHMCCANGLYWSTEKLTCDWTPASEGCELPTVTQAPKEPETTAAFACPYSSDPQNARNIMFQTIVLSTCPDGFAWDEEICSCKLVSAPVVTCERDLLLYYPFEEDFNDKSCNRAHSDIHGQPTLVDDAIRGRVAYFDGSSRLSVQFLNNWFAGQNIDQWTVSVWFQRQGDSSGLGGLVNNGDCVQGASFAVQTGYGDFASGSMETSSVSASQAVEKVAVRYSEWEHLAMVYDGSSISLYLNGELKNGVALTGAIKNRQCAMNIAHEGQSLSSGYFQGLMDELRIYTTALTASQVEALVV